MNKITVLNVDKYHVLLLPNGSRIFSQTQGIMIMKIGLLVVPLRAALLDVVDFDDVELSDEQSSTVRFVPEPFRFAIQMIVCFVQKNSLQSQRIV